MTDNRIYRNGIAGVTIHAHATGQNLNGNRIIGNTIGRNNVLGDQIDLGPPVKNIPDLRTTGILVGASSHVHVMDQRQSHLPQPLRDLPGGPGVRSRCTTTTSTTCACRSGSSPRHRAAATSATGRPGPAPRRAQAAVSIGAAGSAHRADGDAGAARRVGVRGA